MATRTSDEEQLRKRFHIARLILDGENGGDVHHVALALHPAVDAEQAGAENDVARFLMEAWPDHQIGHARLVLDGDRHHPLGRAGLLPQQHQAIHLNDLNRSVHAFWSACLDHPEEMCRRVADTPLDMDEWRKQREIQRAESPSILDLGFSTLYMNRTNRSGVIKGGVIGGKEQAGQWKIDARFNRKDIGSRIEKFASYKSRVTLHGQDALALIKKLGTSTPANTLFYLDPPYYRKADKLYDNHYKPADHAELAEAVAELDRPWVVSYDDQPEIRTLYSAFRQEVFGINYSAGPVAKGSEVMIYGPKINASGSTVSTWRGIAA